MASDTTGDRIVFTCRCLRTENGEADDTLMFEEFSETPSDQAHGILIENSPFDPAGHVVLKDCPQCGLNFLILVIVADVTLYTCSCGYRVKHIDYVLAQEKK